MPRHLPWAVALVLFASPVRANDGLPADVVEAVKKATVYVRVEGDGWSASGSGFVVSADAQAVLIATNQHVIDDDSPARRRGRGKPPVLTVVFDSGTKTERAYTAAVAASDSERDLAVLRLTGVKGVPKPIPFTDAPKLTETMPVYSFGFPFGQALAADSKTSPAVTVGKASISSFRNGPDGELQAIQIDGNLNPGNSGGPVVDAKGKLVGVAVATLKDGQGIGFIIPSGELGQMMRGRVGQVRVQVQPQGDKTTARIEAVALDPLGGVRGMSARYVVVPPKGKRPEADSLDKVTGSKKVDLKAEKGAWVADVPVPAEGELLVQVSVEPAGKGTATRPRAFPLAPTGGTLTGPPPAGWKEYAPWDRSFVIWVPEKPASQSDHDKTRVVNGEFFSVKGVVGQTADGLIYEGQMIRLPIALMRADRRDLQDLIRDAVAAEIEGKVKDTKEVKFGALPGAEYLIEAGRKAIRARLWVFGTQVYLVQVTGTTEQMTGKEAETILNSFRPPFADLQARAPGGGPAPAPSTSTGPGKGPPAAIPNWVKGKEPTILGGAFDPAFVELVPDGALLVGFEVGLAPAFGRTMTRSIRPIYRVGDKESFGEQRGMQHKSKVVLKAEGGYAVGAVSVMHGLGFDGITVKFMKVVDGKLDPKDSYETDYVGSNEKKELTTLGGDGTPVVGIVGKSNGSDLTGFGLLFKGQEPQKK